MSVSVWDPGWSQWHSGYLLRTVTLSTWWKRTLWGGATRARFLWMKDSRSCKMCDLGDQDSLGGQSLTETHQLSSVKFNQTHTHTENNFHYVLYCPGTSPLESHWSPCTLKLAQHDWANGPWLLGLQSSFTNFVSGKSDYSSETVLKVLKTRYDTPPSVPCRQSQVTVTVTSRASLGSLHQEDEERFPRFLAAAGDGFLSHRNLGWRLPLSDTVSVDKLSWISGVSVVSIQFDNHKQFELVKFCTVLSCARLLQCKVSFDGSSVQKVPVELCKIHCDLPA